MFKCQRCKRTSWGGQETIVLEKRQKYYHYYVITYKNEQGKINDKITEDSKIARTQGAKILKEIKSQGWEIVKEIKVCNECWRKQNERN
jgi:hypothetical protein